MPLIPSHRHKAADLDLWRELEEADRVLAKIKSHRLKNRENEALAAIADFLASGAAYCSVSWGKDSVTVAHLCWRFARETGKEIPLVNLRIHPTRNPECDDVRDAFLARFPLSYHEEPVDYSVVDPRLPTIEWDRLTYKLWDSAWARVRTRFGDRHISGVRGSESFARRMRMVVHGWNTKRTCAPLGYWKLEDVFAYLAVNDLPVHPSYAMLGGGRWPREHIRVAEIGDEKGIGCGRREHESEYYGDVLRRLEAGRA